MTDINLLSKEEAIEKLQKLFHAHKQLQAKMDQFYREKMEHPVFAAIRRTIIKAGYDHIPWLDDAVEMLMKERDQLKEAGRTRRKGDTKEFKKLEEDLAAERRNNEHLMAEITKLREDAQENQKKLDKAEEVKKEAHDAIFAVLSDFKVERIGKMGSLNAGAALLAALKSLGGKLE